VTAVFRRLAEEHARARGPADGRRAWERLEPRLYEASLGSPGRRSRRVLLGAGGLALTAALPLGLYVSSDAALSYELEGGREERGLIRAGGAAAFVRFSDASRIRVEPKSELSVAVVGPHAAFTRVNRGVLDVVVAHRPSSDWRFVAGPYEVRVIGTSFRLSWEPTAELFSVHLREGRVRVLGPEGLNQQLEAGASLSRSRRPSTELAQAPPPGTVASALPARRPADVETGGRGGRPVPSARARAARSAVWPELVANGRFAEVVEAASSAGVDVVLRERSAADLKALAQAAHYQGGPVLARRAWSELRKRFPGHVAARQSAFYLGRIHDQQGRRGEALSWFDSYLREAPGDVYAAEARGRRLLLLSELQGKNAARAAARDYLERHPSGAYSRTARAILGER
jgi:hypothetical protein